MKSVTGCITVRENRYFEPSERYLLFRLLAGTSSCAAES
jgi:hypothetical protein